MMDFFDNVILLTFFLTILALYIVSYSNLIFTDSYSMKEQKIKLSQLESLLMDVADILRGKMDAAQYKEYIFGMLFLKRMSDVFDEKRAEIRKKFKHLSPKALDEILEDKTSYGDTFFVPRRARWNEGFVDENKVEQPAIKHLKKDIGDMLNKALAALEDSNETLQGIFKDRINFNKTVDGKQIVKNDLLQQIIQKFNEFPALVNDNFEFPDLLGAAYEYILKYFADEGGKKGGQFYTPNHVVRLLVQLLKPKEGQKIYDPTAGSGGMLIQSASYIEEQGGNKQNLELHGQELDPTVVAICKMNLLLHDITDTQKIKYGDVLEEPLSRDSNGALLKFDGVIANPPFSQNYIKANVEKEFKDRFVYGYAPETGKKADLMFVQHMIYCTTRTGKVVVVMPHGVLFRGGKEYEIRKKMLEADILEGVISLPEKLFYGTGIAACILIFNKSKPEKLKNKVFFVNADRDFGEGKNQNYLRPEDIEKIDYIYSNKIEEPKYSKLVEIGSAETSTKNDGTIAGYDWTLKIRRYVDNTPDAEPQDVRAHISGKVPQVEINVVEKNQAAKFGFKSSALFAKSVDGYAELLVNEKSQIKQLVENDKTVVALQKKLTDTLANWWNGAKNDFASLAQNKQPKKFVQVRTSLLNGLKEEFCKMNVLDMHQVAGVFVNWWDNIKYDLKTIMQFGWDDILISDEAIANKFFATEQKAIDEAQDQQESCEQELSELIEEILNFCNYSPDEEDSDEGESEKKPTISLAKSQLKEYEGDKQAKEYTDKLKSLDCAIKENKKKIESLKESLKNLIAIKRYGADETALDYQQRVDNLSSKKIELLAENQKSKKKIKDIETAIEKLQGLKEKLKETLEEIGGVITADECKELILEKHHSLILAQLDRYVSTERRKLIAMYENLFGKYGTSAPVIEQNRATTFNQLNKMLKKLNYC